MTRSAADGVRQVAAVGLPSSASATSSAARSGLPGRVVEDRLVDRGGDLGHSVHGGCSSSGRADRRPYGFTYAAPRLREDLTVHRSGRTDAGAPTLLLLHGLTDSGRCWPDALARWQDDYRVLAWDARGHGESERFTEQELAGRRRRDPPADVIALLEQLRDEGTSPPVLVGLSMGGGTAAAVAGARPDLLRAAVLEDPVLGGGRFDDGLAAEMAERRVQERQRALDDPEGTLADGRREHPSWPEAEYAPWREAKLQTDVGVLRDRTTTVRTPWPEVVGAIAVPTLVVLGRHGIWTADEIERLQDVGNDRVDVRDGRGRGALRPARPAGRVPRPRRPLDRRAVPARPDDRCDDGRRARRPRPRGPGRRSGPRAVPRERRLGPLLAGRGGALGRRIPAVRRRHAGPRASPRFRKHQLDTPGDVFVDDTVAVLEALRRNGSRLGAVGHSLGGAALTAAAARVPHVVDAMVLVDPPWDTPLVARPPPGGRRRTTRGGPRPPGRP